MLQDLGSDVAFRIVQMEYLQLVQQGEVIAAVDLARSRYVQSSIPFLLLNPVLQECENQACAAYVATGDD